MCVPVDQPLKGLVPEELCSSSSETSQPKGNSEESYSILQGRSSEKSSDDSIVPSSQNSHEFELEQSCALPHVTPERNQLNCSLTESQLENLFETSVSFDEGTAPPCFSDVPSPVQEGYTQIKPRHFRQRESTLIDNIPGNLKSSSRNVAVNHPCLASRQNFIVKESVTRRHSNEGFITCKEKEHVELFSNVADLFEIDRRQSIKRKRCAKDDCVHVTRPSDGTRRGRKALFRDSPVSPDSTSCSVKSSSQSGSSQSQLSHHSPADLYSQQDPLVLDTSGSAESTEGVIDNDGSLLNSPQDGSTSPSLLQRSTMEEPCTLRTPTFDSLPSFQVPAANKGTPSDDVISLSRDQKEKIPAGKDRSDSRT
ncbi:hypothetical protein OS493_009974 [Desmophyllum pertusum]|uniref:Uncharacterized protein n=1 Tax=Desmophyllum pertusum TaxID=174260 RepID=A0A9W9YFZ0_9CNID|nr:hypothetical protein OS493_009974 [Desmophyllum pertusum]